MLLLGREKSEFKAVVVLSALILLSFAQNVRASDLPNVSTVPLAELTYPKEAWSVAVLTQYELGPKYLDKNIALDIPHFPANDSPQTKAELEELLNLKKTARDSSTIEKIKSENSDDPFSVIFEGSGLFDPHRQTAQTKEFLRNVLSEIGYFIIREKLKYARARPVQLAPEVEPVIPTPQHASYPSGHAGQSYGLALILAEIDPNNAEKYIQLSNDVARRREIAGVHYPSDSVAGRELAELVLEQLMLNAKFMADFDAAKKSFMRSK